MAKKTTKTATAKATKTAKSAKAAPAAQVKKDGKGRFWLVPKDGGAEQGPFDTKAQALAAKNGQPAAPETKPAKKTKAAKEPKAKKVGALASQPKRDRRAKRVPDHPRRPEAQMLDQASEVGNVLADAALRGWTLALAVAAPVIGENAK